MLSGNDGCVIDYGSNVDNYDIGVRPALHLNLSSSVWKKGEIVTSEDSKMAITDSLPSGDSSSGSNGSDETTGDDSGNSDSENGGNATGTNTNSGVTVDRGTNTNAGNSAGTGNITGGNSPAGSAGNTSVNTPAKVKSLKVTNKKKGKTVVSFKKINGAVGYQIQYAKNKKFTKGKKSKTTKKTKYTIKKLTKKKTYYFRVRAYVKDSSGNKVYGKWSAVKKLKIKK